MYVDPSKPLPNPTERKDYLGSVLNALLKVHYKRQEQNGDEVAFQQKVIQATTSATQKLNKFSLDIDTALKSHTDKRGAVHGETTESVGLKNVNNWRMGTAQEHIDGNLNNVYAHPAGLKALVQSRLVIDPKNYVGARIIPIASGGLLGTVPQWSYNWQDGSVVQSFSDPMETFTDTPWMFKADSGVLLLPSMNGADVLTQVTADPGRPKRAATEWGGSYIRIYNGNPDLRRTRPSFLKAESNSEPNSELIRGSSHLFDRHSVGYLENNKVLVRGFNHYRLPFDVLSNQGYWNNNWKGILESRENYLYNIVSSLVRGDLGNGDDLYLVIKVQPLTFVTDGIDVKNGPGRPAETNALIDEAYGTVNYTVPDHGKIKIYPQSTGPAAIRIKLRDLVTYTDAELDDLTANADFSLASRIAFTWRNRLNGDFVIRIPVGFKSKDGNYFTNFYLDLTMLVKENSTNKSVNINVSTLRDVVGNIQTLNSNLQVNAAGRFVQYNQSVKGNIFHPKIFNGTFDSKGGHIKAFTLYNRQYVGYYRHDVDGVLDWMSMGNAVSPVLTKYQYAQMSTINNDGFYGDHLRHIPLKVDGDTVDYLTYSRDWRHQYRWAIANVELDKSPELLTPTGHHHGPWRNKIDWVDPTLQLMPSFVISNTESGIDFENSCLVFNTQNNFKGYGRYGYDKTNIKTPMTFLDPTEIEPQILTWIAQNGGAWSKNHKQMFYFRGFLYWFSQTTSSSEIKSDGTDCYYGVIKNVYIDSSGGSRIIRVNGNVGDNVITHSLKVNTKASLDVDTRTITGWDDFNATDVYIMLMERNGNQSRYQVMVNLAPFNNFYFEFETVIDTGTGMVTFAPNSKAVNPIFPYSDAKGFAVDYNKLTGFGEKTPHQLHVNFQTPVMLKKSMWAFRKTVGESAIFSQSIGTVIVHGGLMDTVRGVPIYPVGSVVTAGGSNVLVKSPISAQQDIFNGNDELFVKLYGDIGNTDTDDGAVLYGKNYNPRKFDTEPSSGIVPCGFLKNNLFYHYDPDGWRNALLPVIDNKRMNFYGYGSSFPVLLGVSGSAAPINRFFLADKPSILSWNTATSRTVPIGSGTNIKVTVNNEPQTYTGGGSFSIPAKYTGVVDVGVTRTLSIKWGLGLTNIKQIGNTVTNLDFSGSSNFSCNALLPKRITSLKGLFANATGSNYPGIDLWDTSNVVDMSEMCKGAVNFNHDITNWNTVNVVTTESMFEGASKFNQPIGKWVLTNNKTMKAMFKDAVAFNQDIGTWNTVRVSDFTSMFQGATAFNANIGNWNTITGSNFTSMFEGATSFNIDISRWILTGAAKLTRMFFGATAFNSPLNSWDVSNVVHMEQMFANAVAFNRNIGGWNVGRVTTMFEMFLSATAFGSTTPIDLSQWNVSNVTDLTRMFKLSGFNGTLNNWTFGPDANLTEMFSGAVNFNQDISTWNVANVSSMKQMFTNTTKFNKDIIGWKLDSCNNFEEMFANASFASSVANWTLRSLVGISMAKMFKNAALFVGNGIGTWNTKAVTNFSEMFYGATNFTGDVSSWNVSSGSDFSSMFRDTNVFNVDISGWDVSDAILMSNMFNNATAFNQDLSSWDVGVVTDHTDYDQGATAWVLPRPAFA